MATTPYKELKLPISKSKYEFNLAEFPVTILSKRLPQGLKAIEYQDTIIGKDGQVIPRRWTVSPSSKYGFGTSEALTTLFELFQIWKEQGFEKPIIRFESIYNLVKRMGLEDASYHYERLRKDLNALVGITIEAKNAFWDNEKKAYVDKTFHLFEEASFYRREKSAKQQLLPFAYIQASDILWGSIQTNAILTAGFSGKWFRSLTPTAQRLALYLSKMLRNQLVHKREVTKLAEQLPLQAQSYKKIKHQLTKGSKELLDKGHPLLESFYYEKQKDGQGENIIFLRKEAKEHADFIPRTSEGDEEEKSRRELLVQDILAVTNDPKNELFYHLLARKLPDHLIYAALSETKQANREGKIRTTRARYFTDLVKRYAADQGVTLNPKRAKGGDLP